jgi:translocation and assembly module TamB
VLKNPLAGTFAVAGNLDNLTLKTIQGTGNALLNVGGGTVAVNNIQLAQGNYQAQLRVNNSDVQQLATVPEQVQGRVTGDFQVQGTVDSFQLPDIQATGQGRLNVGNGVFNAANISLKDGNYQAKIQANNVPLQQFITGKVPPQVSGGLNGIFNVAGNVASFKPEDIQLNGDAQLNVAGGTVNATNIQLNKGRYQALVNARGVELNRVNSESTGQFASRLQVSGAINSQNLENLAAVGQVELSRGLAGIEQPLTASIGWNGERLLIQKATSRDVTANGYVDVKTSDSGTPEITDLNLNVVAKNYNLKNLPTKLPNTLTLAGNVDFDGQITGNLPVPNLKGKVGLRNLDVNKLKFEPLLVGNIQSVRGSGLKLDVVGKRDRVALNLDGNNRPQDFNVKWQQATATGITQGNNLAVRVNNFPLTALNLKAPQNRFTGGGGVGGNLTGDVLVNKENFGTSGNIAIAQPALGTIKGNNLTAIFSYNDGQLTLQDSSFTKGTSRYTLAGTFIPNSPKPKIQAKLTATQGNIQDILTTLQVFELQDFGNIFSEPEYGTIADLSNTRPVGLPNQSVLSQLQRISEIQALVDNQQQQRRDASPIPELADLKGSFNGEVFLDTNTANGLAVQFQVNGQNFVWGRQDDPERYYEAQRIIAEGSLENGVLTLLPLRVESNDSLFAFTGNLGVTEQSGQLRIRNFPAKVLNNFVKLPVGLSGNLTGTATIAGNLANPQAKGELRVSEGALNAKGIESANASFSYNNGLLNFGSDINVVAGSEPVTINGSVFYPLPFGKADNRINELNLDVKVKNQGLSVINLFTNQLTFESGKGEVDLMVRGKLKEPTVQGSANLTGATFSALALPGKLTDVTGQAKFNRDSINVENLQGKFSQGRIEAFGEIPISNSERSLSNPLTVNFDKLALNLKSLYQGGVNGSVQITGSALNPLIGGNISLNNGQVLLSESTNTNTSSSNDNDTDTSSDSADNPSTQAETSTPTRFNNLNLKLEKNVRVTRAPILNFTATGSLTLTGSFANPIPKGDIILTQGGVNLFTTQFNLVRGYEHKANFRTSQPRDPLLNIRLFAKVLDVVQSSDFTRNGNSGLAALESVQVEAEIQGFASKLNENLELSSTPSRSQNEIVALLGGGFVDTQGGGAGSTLGLINIAGSAVFNNFQNTFNQIGTALGLSDFRIFPTVISEDPEAGRNFSSLEIAAEAGVDISRKFSVSALKILTANDAPQWGVNYKINNNYRFRASTNFFDDNRAVFEFQRRF